MTDPNPAPQPQPVSDADIEAMVSECSRISPWVHVLYRATTMLKLCREVQAARRQQQPRWVPKFDPMIGDVTGYPPTVIDGRVVVDGTGERVSLAASSTEGVREIHPDRPAPLHSIAERRQAPPVAAGAPSQALTAEGRPAWIDAAAKECADRVLVGEGKRAFTEIIWRHAAAGVAGKGAAGAEAGEGGAR